jgi:hypothetical protein
MAVARGGRVPVAVAGAGAERGWVGFEWKGEGGMGAVFIPVGLDSDSLAAGFSDSMDGWSWIPRVYIE